MSHSTKTNISVDNLKLAKATSTTTTPPTPPTKPVDPVILSQLDQCARPRGSTSSP